jgi:hypothetical protein
LPARRDPPADRHRPAAQPHAQEPQQELTRSVAGVRTHVGTAKQRDMPTAAGPDCVASKTPDRSH